MECLLKLKKELQDASASAKGNGRLLRTPTGKIDYTDDFFGRPAYLTVSGQLQAECAASALTDVYTFGRQSPMLRTTLLLIEYSFTTAKGRGWILWDHLGS